MLAFLLPPDRKLSTKVPPWALSSVRLLTRDDLLRRCYDPERFGLGYDRRD